MTQALDPELHTWWGLLAMYFVMTLTNSDLVADFVRATVPGCPSKDAVRYKLLKEVENVLQTGIEIDQRCVAEQGSEPSIVFPCCRCCLGHAPC